MNTCERLQIVRGRNSLLRLEAQATHSSGNVFWTFQLTRHKCLVDDHFGGDVGQFTSLPRFDLLSHGLEVPLIRSTPTQMQSMSENDFECLARLA